MGNRILLIEDDAAIAQTLKLNLECADYNVTGFDNGLSSCDTGRDGERCHARIQIHDSACL